MKKIFVLLLLLFAVDASAAKLVKQSATGNGSGNDSNNCMSVSTFNNQTGDKGGETYYFVDDFDTRVLVKISNATLDGLSNGDCNPLAEECTNSAVLNQGMGVGADGNNNVDYVTVQDFRMTSTSYDNALQVWPGDSGASADHIIIRRNYIYNAHLGSFKVRYADYFEFSDNKSTNCAQGDDLQSGCNVFDSMDYAYIGRNQFSHDEGSYPSGCWSCNVIEVHSTDNLLFEYNDSFIAGATAPQWQAVIATKENNIQTNHIYRFNKFHGAPEVGLNIGGGDDSLNYFYMYGNYMYDMGYTGGSSYDLGYMHYWWSNIFANNDRHGWVSWDRQQGSTNYIYLYNNTFIKNGDYGPFYPIEGDPSKGETEDEWNRGGLVNQASTNLTAKNNIFWYNRPRDNTLDGSNRDPRNNQVYDARSGSYSWNTYRYPDPPGWTPSIYYNGSEEAVEDVETSNWKIADPGMINPANGDYRLDGTVIGDGTNLGQCWNIAINVAGYTTVQVCTNWGLDPNTTNWNDKPPTVEVLDRSDYQWDRGAYIYTAAVLPEELPDPTVGSKNPSGSQVTLENPREFGVTAFDANSDVPVECRFSTSSQDFSWSTGTAMNTTCDNNPIRPILMVHGLLGDPSAFDELKSYLIGLGYPSNYLFSPLMEPVNVSCDTNHLAIIESQIASILSTTGQTEVDVIGMSRGGMNITHLMHFGSSAAKNAVRNWISLAGNNTGCPTLYGPLGSDRTPMDAEYTSIYCIVDQTIPDPNVTTTPGANNIPFDDCYHLTFLQNTNIYPAILSALRGSGQNSGVADGDGNTHCYDVSTTPGGSYTRYIKCRDNLANESDPVAVSWTEANVDISPPVIGSVSPAGVVPCTTDPLDVVTVSALNVTDTSPPIYCKVSAVDNFNYDAQGVFMSPMGGGSGSNFTYSYNWLECNQTHRRYIKCRDSAISPNTSVQSIVDIVIGVPFVPTSGSGVGSGGGVSVP